MGSLLVVMDRFRRDDSLTKTVGANIRTRRIALGLTQGELSERVGEPQTTISRWERGESMPRQERLIALARELGIAAHELFAPLPNGNDEPTEVAA